MNKPYLSVDYNLVKDTYPRSVQLLKDWIISKSEAAIDMTGEQGKKQLEELKMAITDQYVEAVLDFTPRVLYDFFDDSGIYISVNYHDTLERFLAHDSISQESISRATRWEAEHDIFLRAFSELEKSKS